MATTDPTLEQPVTADKVLGGQATIDTANKVMGITPVDNSSLQQSTPITVPPATTGDPLAGLVNSTNADVLNAQNVDTNAQNQRSSDLTQYQNLSNQLLGKTADQVAAEQAQGIPQYNKQLLDLQNTARQQALEYNTTPYSLQGLDSSRGINGSILRGQEAVKQRELAIENMKTNINIQTMQGNISYAQKLADKAIAAKYDPIEQQIQTKKDIISAHYQDLTASQKKLADAKSAQLDLQTKQIADQKANEKDVQNTALTIGKNMISNGISPDKVLSVMDSIKNAKTFNDRIIAMAPYLQSAEDKATISYKIAQTAEIYNKIKQDALTGGSNLDPSQSLAYAQEFASTGKIPTGIPKGAFGKVAQWAKELPKQHGEIVSTATGVHPSQDTTYADALSGLSSVVQLAKQLKEQDANRIGGLVAGTLGSITGSEAQGSYLSTRQQIVDLLSRARSGAALTENEVKTYEGMLPSRFSEPFGLGQNSDVKIQNFVDNITKDMTQKAASKGWSIYGISKITLSDGKEYTVGDVVTSGDKKGRVNSDGSITLIQ